MKADVAFLDSLDLPALRPVLRFLTGAAARTEASARRHIAAALSDAALLQRCLQQLPAAAQAVADVLCECQGYIHRDHLHRLLGEAVGVADASTGLDVLEAAGLVFSVGTGRVMATVRPVFQAWQPLLDLRWRQSQPPVSAAAMPQMRDAFALQVLLTHVQAQPLRVTRGGQLHARDLAQLHKVFAPWTTAWLEQAVTALRRMGALSPGEGDTLTVRGDALQDAERLDATAWYLILHKAALEGMAGEVLRYFVRRPGPHGLAQVAPRLSLQAESRATLYGSAWPPAPQALLNDCLQRGLLHADAAQQQVTLSAATGAALSTDALQRSLRRLREPVVAPTTGTCHVQPNLEIIVPPELGLRALLVLGRWCDVAKCDSVATLHITRASVQRGAAQGHDFAHLQQTLESVARYGMADNVRRSLDDFHSECRPAFVFDDLVVLLPADAALGHGLPALLQPTRAPGTFRMLAARGAVLRKLQQQGLAPVDERAPQKAYFVDQRPPLAEQVRAVLEPLLQQQECIAALAATEMAS